MTLKTKFHALAAALLLCALTASAQRQLTVNVKPGAPIQPTMYGVFFEDINFGADGGLYAELVANRSFEAPLHVTPEGERLCGGLLGWNVFGNVTMNDANPAFPNNPHYVTLRDARAREKRTGLENRGYFGIGLKKDMSYNFSVYARTLKEGAGARIRVELVNSKNDVIAHQRIDIKGNGWTEYKAQLKSPQTDAHGILRVYLEGAEGVDLDHVSLFPADSWNGLRQDLVQALADLHPGVFRFPGGCIVEGHDLATRYQWKHSVGAVENRPLNENRWNYTFAHRLYPNYYQSYGLGFYEYFLLAEHIGAEPLPILNVGIACQYQNDDADEHAHVSGAALDPYIQDVLDLIEFANGSADSQWGKVRAEMGHPEPFNLKFVGIGNEQWGPLYPERLEKFMKVVREKYPDIKIVGSSGPSADGDKFDYGWQEMRRLKADLVDEHYYMAPDWFLSNAARYDNYDRKGPKVFAGEYASHRRNTHGSDVAMNCFEAALSEAAFMTGLERNADVVHMATYAPLFAHVEGWQWRPDLIWFDNLESVRSVNWYVQMLYGTNCGTNVLNITENKQPLTGQDGLYASAVIDKRAGCYIVKLVNTSDAAQNVTLTFKGAKSLPEGTITTLHSDDMLATNSLQNKLNVVPKTEKAPAAEKNVVTVTVPAKTFAVVKY